MIQVEDEERVVAQVGTDREGGPEHLAIDAAADEAVAALHWMKSRIVKIGVETTH